MIQYTHAALMPIVNNKISLTRDNDPEELVLVGHGLSVVPPQVWETSDITKVDLSKNSIETLPDELSSCTSLEIPLTGFQAAFKLQILDLSNNVGCLPEHPVFSCLLQLQELYIRRMQISKDLLEPSLQVLQLDGNPLRRHRSVADAPKHLPATLNSGVYPDGPPVPIRSTKMRKYVDIEEVSRGSHDMPGHWLVIAAKLVMDDGKIGLHVKFALLDFP
ncbi:MACPF domain-containing protein-like protein [Tanacetum coccineum]